MIGTDHSAGDGVERCETCAVQTPHDVSIEIRTESDKEKKRRVLSRTVPSYSLPDVRRNGEPADEQRVTAQLAVDN